MNVAVQKILLSHGDNGFKEQGGWERARTVTEISGVVFESSEQVMIGVQKLGNAVGGTSSEILTAGKLGKLGGTALGFFNLGTTIASGLTNRNGWENHQTADVVVSAMEIGLGLFEATSPIGWAFGVGMFVGNLISEHYTHHTITENLFDN